MKFNSKSSIIIIIIPLVSYYFYRSVYFGYYLSKIFFTFFDEINKADSSKSSKLKKKFSSENIKKTISDFFWKIFKNWYLRVVQKFVLLAKAISKVAKALKIFKRKFRILKFRRNLQLLKLLLLVLLSAFRIILSFVNEILLLSNIYRWIIQWRSFIQLLMTESVFITRVIYFLYLVLIGLFGLIIGIWLGIYQYVNEVELKAELLLLLVQLFIIHRSETILLESLPNLFLEANTADLSLDFPLKSIEQIEPRPPKIVFSEPKKRSFPFPIIEDPYIFIEIEVIPDEKINYQFELWQLYRHENSKKIIN